MKDKPESTPPGPSSPAVGRRARYASPVLRQYGAIRNLTTSGIGSKLESSKNQTTRHA
jgi:hypothetical protein